MSSITRKLPKSEWQAYFDKLSKHLQRETVSVLVEGLDLGVQPEAERLTLYGITYDHADDAIEIATEALTHRISGPRDLYVQEDTSGALLSLKLTDAEGHEQIVQLDAALTVAKTG
jgi:hypothetical protein